jgi:hypothetical protein
VAEPDQIAKIRLVHERVVADDVEGLLELADPGVEYHNPEHALESGIRRGRDGLTQAFLNIMEGIDFTEISILRWATHGNDEAIVEIRSIGTGRDSGAPFDQRLSRYYVFDGNLIKRFEWFGNWDDAAAKAGFDPGTWQQSE